MKIGILGTGNVGGILGIRWAQNGHQVVFGSRDPGSAKVREILNEAGSQAKAADTREAVAQSDIVILTVPWDSARDVIESVDSFEGKILVDCTNPLKSDLSGLTTDHTTSAGEEIAKWAKGAKVVKAFNSIGTSVMESPEFNGDKAVLFICGDDGKAKQAVTQLAEDLGFEVLDSGDLSISRYLEQLAMMWIHLAFRQGLGPDFAFKFLKR